VAITAVYAFCREVDDAVDAPGQKDPAAEVARWREEVARTYAGAPSTALTRSLSDAISRFDLTRAYFDGSSTGWRWIGGGALSTFESLAATAIMWREKSGSSAWKSSGTARTGLKGYAAKLGMAFQLTNILRDVSTDAEQEGSISRRKI